VDRWKETATSIDEDIAFLVRIKVTTYTRPCRRWCKQQCQRGAGGRPGGGGAGGGTVAGNPLAAASGGPMSPTNGSPPTPRERRSSSIGSQTDRELLAEMDRDLDAYRRTSNFYKAMHRLTHSAKVYKNVDLFQYLKKLYENEPDSDKLFVGVDELCDLAQKHACPSHLHAQNGCLANDVVTAYAQLKSVIMVGESIEHVTVWEQVNRRKLRPYNVVKVRGCAEDVIQVPRPPPACALACGSHHCLRAQINKVGRMQPRQLYLMFEESAGRGPDDLPSPASRAASPTGSGRSASASVNTGIMTPTGERWAPLLW